MSRQTFAISHGCRRVEGRPLLMLGKKQSFKEEKAGREGRKRIPYLSIPSAKGLYSLLTASLFCVSYVLLKKIASVRFSFILFKTIHSYNLSCAFLQSFTINHSKVNFQKEGQGRCLSALILDSKI